MVEDRLRDLPDSVIEGKWSPAVGGSIFFLDYTKDRSKAQDMSGWPSLISLRSIGGRGVASGGIMPQLDHIAAREVCGPYGPPDINPGRGAFRGIPADTMEDARYFLGVRDVSIEENPAGPRHYVYVVRAGDASYAGMGGGLLAA